MGYLYCLYGLKILSPVLLRGLQNVQEYKGQPVDVTIQFQPVENVHIRSVSRPEMEFGDDVVSIVFQGGWKMSISKKGDTIVVYSTEKFMDIACTLILGTGLDILLLYRNILPLHAGGFVYDGRGVALSGVSGSGKSTFMQHVLTKGYKLISDDCLPLVKNGDKVICYSSESMKTKLTKNSVERLVVAADSLDSTPIYNGKYWVTVESEKRTKGQVQINTVYLLAKNNENVAYCEELTEAEKYKMLVSNILCLNNLPIRDIKERMGICRDLAKNINLTRLYYPRTIEGLDLALAAIQDHEKYYKEGELYASK